MLLVHPFIAEAQPLIVAGTPRSGTRFVTNAYNKQPAIQLIGEFNSPPTKAAIQCIQTIEDDCTARATKNDRQASWAHLWPQRRQALLYALWSSLSKNPVNEPKRPLSWFGYKTPYHERYWREYRDILHPLRPKWVICIRNFVDHYLSMEAMHPTGIGYRAKQYSRTVDHHAEMKHELGSDVSLFVLDDFRKEGVGYVQERLFDDLGIEVDADALAKTDLDKPANDSATKGLSKRELTGEERAFLDDNPDLEEALDLARQARGIGAA